MFGCFGKILKVDLSVKKWDVIELDENVYRDFLGGSGIAARLFFDMRLWNTDPLGEENVLFVMNGPISGTTLPGCSRLEICARSPLTEIWGESSMGGHVSPQLRASGYDGVVVVGVSEKPVYLLVSDESVEIRDASHIWGKDTFETEELIRKEIGSKRVRVMSIGPAGENLVRFASVVNDKGSIAGRTGMGAVMGSKRLKAIAFSGKAKTKIADETAFNEVKARAIHNIKTSMLAEGLRAFGSNVHMEMGMAISDVPVKNWRESQWEEGMDALSGVTVAETILTKNHSCYACPVSCKRIVRIDSGPYRMEEGPGLEYEGASALGTLTRCNNLEAVTKANEIADRYGLDCISAGSTIAYATEAFEKGIITTGDTGGLEFKWNDPEGLVKLIRMIAFREGFGDELAEGSRILSEKYGGKEFAIHVKGLECPMHDPRALWALSLTYATGVRGACHVNDDNLMAELGVVTLKEAGVKDTKPKRAEGKALQTIAAQSYGQLAGSAVICLYAWWSMGGLSILRDMINAVTGAGYTNADLVDVGNRIWYLKRSLGLLCGMRASDDVVPERLLLPHEEGVTSELVKILNPGLRVSRYRVHSEKIAGFTGGLARKYVFTNLFKILTTAGKVLPGGRAASEKSVSTDISTVKRIVDFEFMLKEFYRLRDLDERGFPSRRKLEEIGLAEVADELEGI